MPSAAAPAAVGQWWGECGGCPILWWGSGMSPWRDCRRCSMMVGFTAASVPEEGVCLLRSALASGLGRSVTVSGAAVWCLWRSWCTRHPACRCPEDDMLWDLSPCTHPDPAALVPGVSATGGEGAAAFAHWMGLCVDG